MANELVLAALHGIFKSKKKALAFLEGKEETDPGELLRLAKAEKKRQKIYTSKVVQQLPSKELMYVVRNLALCGIPQEKPEGREVRRYIRLPDGVLQVTFSSSRDDVPVVHGIADRRVFAWICTEGIKSGSNRVWLHGDLREALEKIGFETEGSGYQDFYQSLERWKRAKIELDWVEGTQVGKVPIQLGAGLGAE